MTISIQRTKLSSMTLNHIERMAEIIAGGGCTQEQITLAMVQIATLGFYDGKLSGYDSILEPDTFPNELNWSNVTDGRISSEINQ